ncbi:MAG: NADH-quinone oxidoreductase subunit L, partial [Pseudomonadota bacterium]
FVGAMGKSAQFILHTWLPDAMEGPTPVSALIHAATMVTAGVFLVCRMSPIYEFAPGALTLITALGALTAFFAATVGLVQNDIKRVIAYSTCSQLGYMFVAAGVGVYQAAMFHLFTHAFFKALLFLGAGSVIHAMHHEQDMRHYGGLRSRIPVTFWTMMLGTLAITGVGIPILYLGFPVGFAGFISKDVIIESAFAAQASGAFWILVIAALMTSFYSWRLVFMTFYGTPRGDAHTHEHAHESPMVMLVPLYILAAGAVMAGMLFYGGFVGSGWEEFWHAAIFQGAENHVLEEAHHVPIWVKLSPFVAMLAGLGIAYWFYIHDPTAPKRLAANQSVLYRFLLNKWYIDEIYDAVFVRPVMWVGRLLWKKGDGATIDGGINGLAMGIIPFFTRIAGRAQSGYLFHYAFAIILGLAVMITWFVLGGAG